MRVLTNSSNAILNRVRSFVKKNNKVIPFKLADGRWAVSDAVLTDPTYAEWWDEIISRTTFVPDLTVTIDQGTRPPFVSLPKPAPQPPPVRPT